MSSQTIERLRWALYGLCAVLLLAEFFAGSAGAYLLKPFFGFYALVGVLSAGALLLASDPLRDLLARPEDDDGR